MGSKKELAIVVGVHLKKDPFEDMKESLAELEELVYAAGGEVVGTVAQTVNQYSPKTLIGSGKVEEIGEMVKEGECTLVVIDHKLSGVQSRNLEKIWGIRVLDRSQLILDIFAQRAQTYEGKLQVELAQMLDQLPRMVGGWLGSLSRLGGGIGTRGPGETALEMDRRRINDRIKMIRKKLENVRKHRNQHRQKRRRRKVPSFALVGYTNSGKSTLLNTLTSSTVLAKDQVFATLDPTTRQIHLPDLGEAVITDTVGFIRKLPTHLVEAFKATLEESADADVLLHVVDLSNPQMEKQCEVVQSLIEEFKWQDKPVIHVFNKIDAAPFESQWKVKEHPRVFISAKEKQGIDKLKTEMIKNLQILNNKVELFFDNENEHKIYDLSREAKIEKTEKGSTGTVCYAYLSDQQKSDWKKYLILPIDFDSLD